MTVTLLKTTETEREHRLINQIFPRTTGWELKLLVESIREDGIREPLVLAPGRAPDGRERVLKGRARLKAARILGLPFVPVVVRRDLDTTARQLEFVAKEELKLNKGTHRHRAMVEDGFRELLLRTRPSLRKDRLALEREISERTGQPFQDVLCRRTIFASSIATPRLWRAVDEKLLSLVEANQIVREAAHLFPNDGLHETLVAARDWLDSAVEAALYDQPGFGVSCQGC